MQLYIGLESGTCMSNIHYELLLCPCGSCSSSWADPRPQGESGCLKATILRLKEVEGANEWRCYHSDPKDVVLNKAYEITVNTSGARLR